jgi:hypothetical protein
VWVDDAGALEKKKCVVVWEMDVDESVTLSSGIAPKTLWYQSKTCLG